MVDNKKIYQIQINGIDQSIKQVDALAESLNALEKKIKELEGKNVSISAPSTKVNSQDLQAEEQILKQIQSIEQQITTARSEGYQKLIEEKDVLKEAKELQEQRAAAERLSSGGYGNTMKGLKQELSDIKKVMQTTDLGDEKFQELTRRAGELTNKLKELETAYGQFGRNVGNYPNSMGQGLDTLKIEVNGVTREFANARQALKELTNERNTLKLMGQDVGNLDNVVKTLKSDIKDMEMSSATMDNLLDSMQGLIALGSTAEGFAALFGFDNDAIEQTIKKLVALQNILQGIETIKKQMQTGEGIGGLFAKGNAAIDKFSASLVGVKTNAKAAKVATTEVAAANTAVATTAGAATIAVKALSFALKTVGIGVILTAVAFLVEGLQSLIEWFTKADDAAEKAKKVNEDCAKAYAEAKSTITNYTEKVKNFNGTKQQEKKLVDELNSQLGKELGTYKTLAEWQKVLKERGDAYCESMLNQARAQAALNAVTEAYINLQQVQANIQSGEYHHWYQTVASDREADARELEKANQKIEAAENEYRRIVSESIQFDKTHSLGNFSPQIETAKSSGGKMVKTVKDIEADIYKAKIDAMKSGLVKTLAQLELERNKRIAEAKKSGKLVQEQIEQINSEYQNKIFDARVQYHINLINEEKSYQEKLKKVQQDTYQAEVDYSKKMNDLRLESKVNGDTNQAPQAITDMQGHPFENISKLTIDYNSSDVRKYLDKYNQDVIKAYINTKNTVDYLNKALDGANKHFDDLDEEGKKIYDKYAKKLLEAQAQLEQIEQDYEGIGDFVQNKLGIISEKLSEAYALRTQSRREYYKKILEYTQEAADQELKIEKDKLEAELKMNEDAEKERHKLATSRIFDTSGLSQDDQTRYSKPRNYYKVYKESYDSGELAGMNTDQIGTYFSNYRKEMNKWLDEMAEDLKKFNGKGKYTWEEYNEIMNSEAMKGYQKMRDEYNNYLKLYNEMSAENKAKNKDAMASWTQAMNNAYVEYLEKVRQELETHNNKMTVLQNTFNANTEEAERESLKKRQAATTEFYTNLISENESALSAINSKIDKAEKVTPLGIINYKATKRELTDLKGTVEQVLNDIAIQKQELLEKLKKGEISFGDYDNLISQLKTIETQAQETGDNVKQKLQNLFTDTMQSISQIASQLGSSLNSLIGAIGDYQDQQYENELNKLEKFISEYEEKLNKQKEITQEHVSKLEDIESELANARGDRRQMLIDQLNAEIAAQRASLAEEKKIEKEKQKLEKQKEKEEKERLEKQKEMQTTQAIINGAVAVMNALATPPVWLGIAMAAVMAATTAVQIATIQSQKYAEGGVIQGRSHAQGGVKVLGGRAEVEGGEYITNKKTTSKNVDLLDYINSKKKRINLEDMLEFYSSNNGAKKTISTTRTKFADGGVVPTLRNDIDMSDRLYQAFEDYSNRPVVVSVVDIIDRTQNVNEVKTMAGLY